MEENHLQGSRRGSFCRFGFSGGWSPPLTWTGKSQGLLDGWCAAHGRVPETLHGALVTRVNGARREPRLLDAELDQPKVKLWLDLRNLEEAEDARLFSAPGEARARPSLLGRMLPATSGGASAEAEWCPRRLAGQPEAFWAILVGRWDGGGWS